MSKYYADDDINNPQHPEFDRETRVPATPKVEYLVHITVRNGNVQALGALIDDFVDSAGIDNVDIISGALSANFDNGLAWRGESIVRVADINIISNSRLEDLDPYCEFFAKKHNVYVRAQEKNCKKVVCEFNVPTAAASDTQALADR